MTTLGLSGFVVLLVFYGAYLLKMLLQRRKGISANRMAKGEKEKNTRLLEQGLAVITVLMAAMQFISVLLPNFFSLVMNAAWVRYCGILLAVIGALIFIAAMATMKDSWRAGVDTSQKTSIVTTGIYRFSRNPAFVGFDFLYVGIAVAFSNLLLLLLSTLAILLFHLQILQEERYLPSIFGEDYLAYQKHTPRYFLFF